MKRIALRKINGKIVDKSDDDSYEFEIQFSGKEYAIEMNAYTGVIEEFEVDDED